MGNKIDKPSIAIYRISGSPLERSFGTYRTLATHFDHDDKNRVCKVKTKCPDLVISRHGILTSDHFLPPGVACTTGLSHNPFTWRPL